MASRSGPTDRFSLVLRVANFGRTAPVFREGEEEAVSTSLENALWCRAALPSAKNISYLNQRFDRMSEPLEGRF
jgi:hypothetical protein